MTGNKKIEEWTNSLMEENVSVSEAILSQIKMINFLWEELDKLTEACKIMSDRLKEMDKNE